MVNRTLDELVRDVKQRREVGDAPLVVLLGAGASVDAGIGAMEDLFQFVGVKNFDEFVGYINPFTSAERYRLLARFLQSRQPSAVTPGYHALAALCADACFDLILTTNLDPLLDDALSAAQLWRKDYLLVVNGVIRPERLDLLLSGNSPRVKVIKLHGDLFHRFMAWTPNEMEAFLNDIAVNLTPVLHGRDVLVVGLSLRDDRIRKLALGADGVIWYTNVKSVPDVLKDNDRVRAVIGAEARFEKLFAGLAQGLGVGVKAPAVIEREAALSVPRRAVARTVDDLMASVVAVVSPTDEISSTGFVVDYPRVVVIDGYVGNTGFIKDEATLATSDGRRLQARVLKRHKAPFGPVILEAPGDLKVPGLQLNTAPVTRGATVRIGVAAGTRIGVSSGIIKRPKEVSVKIEPIGLVKNLVEIDAAVAPGASGAPVVDEQFAVCGFVVAGRPDQPPALMYPAARWAKIMSVKQESRKQRARKHRVR